MADFRILGHDLDVSVVDNKHSVDLIPVCQLADDANRGSGDYLVLCILDYTSLPLAQHIPTTPVVKKSMHNYVPDAPLFS